MIHARSDYDPIQDPRGLIPEDEPVVLFRAQDELAVAAVIYYTQLCKNAGLSNVDDILEPHIEKMLSWPKKKLPDVPSEVQPKN